MSVPTEKTKFLFEISGSSYKTGVTELMAEESISAPFKATLTLACEQEIEIDKVMSKEGLLTIKGDKDDRLVHGIINRFGMVGKKGRFFLYEAELVPQLWLLSQEQDSRIYQKQAVKEIVTQTLEDAFINNKQYAFRFQETYAAREYCVQYQETDFAFVSRLLEDEGIWYFFEHSNDKHTAVFADSTAAYKPLPGGNSIPYKQAGGMVPKEESIYQFRWSQTVCPGKVSQTDYNYLKPSLPLGMQEEAKANKRLEVFEFPGGYEDQEQGKKLTQIRLQEKLCTKDLGQGASTCARLMPGHTFSLTGHSATFNKEYLITSVKHKGTQPQTLQEEAGKEAVSYANEFTVIPAAVTFRPKRKTPWPRVKGSQTAIVTGPHNYEIYTDEHARVKLKFHWDRQDHQNKEQSSCWVRVSQAWAGAGYGSVFIPRVGDEVIVDFITGDPDKPIVTGRVYNGGNIPPHKLPDNVTKSTILTNTSKGKGANELSFEDDAGHEEIYLHAQKDLNIKALNNKTQTIGANETKDVTGDHNESIGGNQTETIGKSKAETVALGSAETVGLAKALTIGGAYQTSVGAAMNETVAGAKAEQIGGIKAVYVGGDMTEDISGDRKEVTTNTHTITADELHIRVDKNHTIKAMNSNMEIAGNTMFRVGKKSIIAEEIEFRCGKASLTMTNQKIEIVGNNFSLTSMGDVKLKGKNIYKEEAEEGSSIAPVVAEKSRPELVIGVFFDGTGNNMLGDPPEKHTNVAKLREMYLEETTLQIIKRRIYVEGVGTKAVLDPNPDDPKNKMMTVTSLYGLATGLGTYGAGVRLNQARDRFLFELRQYRSRYRSMPDKITFDVFGFSRGAMLARHFVNMVKAGLPDLKQAPICGSPSIYPDLRSTKGVNPGKDTPADSSDTSQTCENAMLYPSLAANVRVRFVGLFDSVGSFFLAGNADEGFINPHLGSGSADCVYQLTARNEIRKNFPLTTIDSVGVEEELFGAHSDVGGGYDKTPEEILISGAEESYRGFFNADPSVQSDPTWEAAMTEKAKRISAQKKIDCKVKYLGGANGDTAYFYEVRHTKPDLSKVSLKAMHEKAKEKDVPLRTIDPADTVPPELDQLVQRAKAGDTAALKGYIHTSHVAILTVENLANAAEPSGKRTTFPNQPSRAITGA